MDADVGDDLLRRLAAVEEREREVEKRERSVQARGLRHNLYDRITLSRRTVDAIIIVCAVAIVTLVVVGYVMGSK